MSSIIKVGDGSSRLTRRPPRSATFLAPMTPDQAGRLLDETLHGKRTNKLLITPQRLRSRFDGGVQGSAFWVQSKGASFNPMERRVDGTLVPCADGTEVRYELRKRGAAAATVAVTAGMLGLLTVLIVPLAIIVMGFGWGTGAIALLTLLAGLWVILAAALYAATRVAGDGEEQAMHFVAATLEAPDRELLGL